MSSQEKEQFNPLPASGDIVFCRFPQTVGVPGPKSRPALVVGVSKDDHEVQVIYGTSQKTDRLYPTEILLSQSDAGFADSGLCYATKFDTGTIVQLPFDNEWFDVAPGQMKLVPLPKMGVLHPSYMPKLIQAYKNNKPKKK